jgi:hypothetical protein
MQANSGLYKLAQAYTGLGDIYRPAQVYAGVESIYAGRPLRNTVFYQLVCGQIQYKGTNRVHRAPLPQSTADESMGTSNEEILGYRGDTTMYEVYRTLTIGFRRHQAIFNRGIHH